MLPSTRHFFPWACVPLLFLGALNAFGEITVTGDTIPAPDDSYWSTGNSFDGVIQIGYDALGSVVLSDGGQLTSKTVYLGENEGSLGNATATGAGTLWTITGVLDIGYNGVGVFRIEEGAVVDVGERAGVNMFNANSDGQLIFDGGILNTTHLDTDASDMSGTGTIHTSEITGSGYVFDFNGSALSTTTITNGGSDSITLNYTATPANDLIGNFTARNGASLSLFNGYVGFYPEAAESAVVTGTGTELNLSGDLYVGDQSDGSLSIVDSASVNVNKATYISHGSEDKPGAGQVALDSGTLNAGMLYADAADFSGNGTLTMNGILGSGFAFDFDGSDTGVMQLPGGDAETINVYLTPSTAYPLSADLNLSSGAKIASSQGLLGVNETDSNLVVLDGAATLWGISGKLSVGDLGDADVTVQDGASLTASNITLGQSSSSYGALRITGAESSLTGANTLTVGVGGEGLLQIDGSGSLGSTTSVIGQLEGATGSATVSGEDSGWTAGSLYVGQAGTGTLQISNGAGITASSLRIGRDLTGSGNLSVSGSGSTLTATETVYAGASGNGVLTLTSGGNLTADSLILGDAAGSSGTVGIDGLDTSLALAGNLEIGKSGSGSLSIASGAIAQVGGTTSVHPTNGTLTLNDGTLETTQLNANQSRLQGSGTIFTKGVGGTGYALSFDGSDSATQAIPTGVSEGIQVVVDASNSPSTLEGSVSVINGAVIQTRAGTIGVDPENEDTALISGSGSAWNMSERLYVGYTGDGTLRLEGGATMTNHLAAMIAYESDVTGTVTLTGEDSNWNLGGGSIQVGWRGNGFLHILNGATLTNSREGHLAGQPGSYGEAVVDGAGSWWQMTDDLFVSRMGNARLSITNGGAVSNADAFISTYDGVSGSVSVDGTGSSWTNERLFIGEETSGSVSVTNGASASGTWVYIGLAASGEASLDVEGAGSSFTSSDGILVGSGGYGAMNVKAGGVVTSAYGNIGQNGAAGGAVLVTGTDSAWNMSNDLTMSRTSDSSLTVADGGSVTNAYALLGDKKAAGISISGPESTWTTSAQLTLGNNGSAEFVIEDGAYVLSGYARIGKYGYIDASGNHVGAHGAMTIVGSGSHWRNADDLYIGDRGSGRIEITNGGSLHSRDGFLGYADTGLGEVRLSDADSWWEVVESLHVGYGGDGELTIENGARISVRDDVSIQTNAGASGELNVFASATTAIEAGSNGTGSFINNGLVRLMATPGIPAGGYTPITVGATEGSFSGTGLYQAFGGIWDTDSKTFTTSDIVDSSDDTISGDLSGRRYRFDSGKVAVGFPSDAGVAAFSIASLEVPGMNLEKNLGAYSITSDAGALPLLLSVYVGTEFAVTELSFQTRGDSSGTWDDFSPLAYSYHDGWANFVVEASGDYAVTFGGYADRFAAFRDIYGLDPAGADDLADWSGDGVPNLLYFASGLGDPSEAGRTDLSRLPSHAADADFFTFTYTRLIDASGGPVQYTVSSCTDLANGDWQDVETLPAANQAIAETATSLDENYEQVTLTFDLLDTSRFYRLTVQTIDEN